MQFRYLLSRKISIAFICLLSIATVSKAQDTTRTLPKNKKSRSQTEQSNKLEKRNTGIKIITNRDDEREIIITEGFLEGLESLKGLEELNVLEGMQSLQGLESLEALKGLESLSGLESLGELQELEQLQEMEPLQELETTLEFEYLNLHESFEGLEELHNLQHLEHFELNLHEWNNHDNYENLTEDEIIKLQSLQALINSDDGNSLEVIKNFYNKQDHAKIRKLTVKYIAAIQTSEAVELLGKIAKTDSDAEVRKRAIYFLGQSKNENAIKILQDILNQ